MLDPRMITSEQFNNIPLVETQPNIDKHLNDIFDLFHKHNVAALYTPHLLHRHFELKPDHVMLSYALESDSRVHVTRPRLISDLKGSQIRAHLLYLNLEGKWQAYEYEEGETPLWNVEFLAEFKSFVLKHDLVKQVALRSSPLTEPLMEYEIGSIGTAALPLIPDRLGGHSVSVEWGVTPSQAHNNVEYVFANGRHEVRAEWQRCATDLNPLIGDHWPAPEVLLEWLKSYGYLLDEGV